MNRILDRLLTVLMLALLGWAGFSAVHWLLFSADWSVVTNNLPLYALGGYPLDQRWRPLVWIALLIVMTAVTLPTNPAYSTAASSTCKGAPREREREREGGRERERKGGKERERAHTCERGKSV